MSVITIREAKSQYDTSTVNIQYEKFLEPAINNIIGRPVFIDTDTSGLLIADQGYMRIIKVNVDGDVVFEFGREGRGPGEFEILSGLWSLKSSFVIYDYNNFKFLSVDYEGHLKRETKPERNPADLDSEYAIPVTVDVASDSTILIPVYGRGDALFAIADLEAKTTTYVGTPVFPYKFMDDADIDRVFSKGDNPNNYQNFVLLESNSSVIYCFIQTTGMLQKYSLDGELLWSKEVSYPGQTGLFDEIRDYNIIMRNATHVQQYFFKARAMKALEDGVIVLLNMPENKALTLAWISKDGSMIKFAKAKDVHNNRYGLQESITASENKDYIYYLQKSSGIIYRFIWPF